MRWKIHSYERAGPLQFGIDPGKSAQILGPPKSTRRESADVTKELRGLEYPVLYFENNRLKEIVFPPETQHVYINNLDVFKEEPIVVLRMICAAFGPCLLSEGGTIVSLGGGVALSGFHDGDESQKGISAFARGAWTPDDLDGAEEVVF